MAQGWLGYDPERVVTLGHRLGDAAEHLDGIASDEPAAATAIATIRRVSATLRTTWLLVVARVGGDTSMTQWTSTAPAPPTTGDPAAVAEWWSSLSDAHQQAVIAQAPATIGNLDGIPAWARDAANRAVLADDLDTLEQEAADGTLSDAEADRLANARATDQALTEAEGFVDPRTGQPVPVQLFVYDSGGNGGDGRVAIAIGDLDTAEHVAVQVPGMGTEVDGIGTTVQQNIYTAASAHTDAGIAVVAWHGYDAPSLVVHDGSDDNPVDDAADWITEIGDLAHVVTTDKATAGAALLAADVAGINAMRSTDAHVTVIGNSYGSTTVAIAADEFDLEADDVILTGSPGAGDADRADDLTTGSEHTWVGSASDDPVTYFGTTGGAEPHDAVELIPRQVGFDLDLGLGNDPAEDDFGAQRFQAEHPGRDGLVPWNFDGHGHYYEPGGESLENIGAIVAGDYAAVHLAEHRHKDESWDWYDPLADFFPDDPEADQPVDEHRNRAG